MNNSTLSSTAHRLYWLLSALALVLPPLLFVFWMIAEPDTLSRFATTSKLPVSELAFGQRIAGLVISLLTIAPVLFILVRLRKLFALYARGILFSRENITALRDTGFGFVAYAAVDLITDPLFSLALTYNNPEGQRMISVGISASTFGSVCLGFIILAIAKAMDEARRINDEHALTV